MTWWDVAVAEWMVERRTAVGDVVAHAFMAVGTRPVLMAAVGLLALGAAALARQFRLLLALPVAAVGASVLGRLLKAVVDQPRPPRALAVVEAAGSSMPSSAAMLTAAVAVAGYMCLDDLAPRARRLVGVVLAIGVATTGWSVVYLGAHWVTDVLVGWVLGAALGVGVGLVARRVPIGRRLPDEADRPG